MKLYFSGSVFFPFSSSPFTARPPRPTIHHCCDPIQMEAPLCLLPLLPRELFLRQLQSSPCTPPSLHSGRLLQGSVLTSHFLTCPIPFPALFSLALVFSSHILYFLFASLIIFRLSQLGSNLHEDGKFLMYLMSK